MAAGCDKPMLGTSCLTLSCGMTFLCHRSSALEFCGLKCFINKPDDREIQVSGYLPRMDCRAEKCSAARSGLVCACACIRCGDLHFINALRAAGQLRIATRPRLHSRSRVVCNKSELRQFAELLRRT